MSIDDAISGALAAQLAPLRAEFRAEIRRLASEVEAVRRALPLQLVTVADAAAALGVSVGTVRRRLKDGSLRRVQVGGAVRVDLASLHAPSDAEVDAATIAARR